MRKSLTVLLLVVILFAAGGFSYSVHFCHGNQEGIALYPELTRNYAGCGCEKGEVRQVTVNHNRLHPGINKSGCCKNLHFFHKINTLSTEQFRFVLSPVVVPMPASESDLVLSDFTETALNQVVRLNHPPPVSGKKLVLFLSQLRIPLISGDC